MDYLNNIASQSLVRFPIIKKEKFINEIEYLDYLQSLYSSLDAHLGLNYVLKFPDVPYSKINKNGYCYIYLPTNHDTSISSIKETNVEYLREYKKIMATAKREGCRKYVIITYGDILNDDFWYIIQPFTSGSVSFGLHPPKRDSGSKPIIVETYGLKFRSRFFTAMNSTLNLNPRLPNKIRVDYDELIVFVPEKQKYLNAFLQKTKNTKFYVDKKYKSSTSYYNILMRMPVEHSNGKSFPILYNALVEPELPVPEPIYVDHLPVKYLPNS